MLPLLLPALEMGVKVVVVTRPMTDFKDNQTLTETLNLLQQAGINLVYKSRIHQKFAVFDQSIVWYGSINLLSFGHSEESIMRLESLNIASELMRSIGESVLSG